MPRPSRSRPSSSAPPCPLNPHTPPSLSHIAPSLRGLAKPVASLRGDPANLRRHGPESIAAIKASLARFGQRKPIVVDAAGVTIAGAGLLEAAAQLGWTAIAAAQDADLSPTERVLYAIADNRTAELSTWDAPALKQVLETFAPEDMLMAGFTPDDIEQLLEAEEEDPVREDEAPDVQAVAITRPGDLWILGEHRLLCGDATRAEDVDRVMEGKRAALVATDPPYLVDYTGSRPDTAGGSSGGKDWSATYREHEIGDPETFYRAALAQVLRVLAPRAAVYWWHAHARCGLLQRLWEELGLLDHQQIVWVKPAPVFGRVFWHFQHECCMMGWAKGSMPAYSSDHSLSSAWSIDWEGKARVVGNEHPTQKPVEIFARPMRKHTRKGALCFEPFCGSGTQIIAAEQLGRRCRAIELEPTFVDVAIRRWQALTGRQAVLEGGGSFADAEAQRAA